MYSFGKDIFFSPRSVLPGLMVTKQKTSPTANGCFNFFFCDCSCPPIVKIYQGIKGFILLVPDTNHEKLMQL